MVLDRQGQLPHLSRKKLQKNDLYPSTTPKRFLRTMSLRGEVEAGDSQEGENSGGAPGLK